MKNTGLSPQGRMYQDLAWLWPIISPPEDYLAEALQFVDLIRSYGDRSAKMPETLLHLGSGGGHLDLTLKKYFLVTGVDLSPMMLGLARSLNPDVPYIQGDMRTLRLGQTFDAVLIADSIDYMLDEGELQAAFQTAWDHLKPGGIFVTYAEETLERFENNRTDHSTYQQNDVEVTLIENLFDPDPNDSTYEMTFLYLIRKVGELTIEIDQHVVGIFSLVVWKQLLKEVGFDVAEEVFEGEEIPLLIGRKVQNPHV